VSEFIRFVEQTRAPRTRRFSVVTKDGETALGEIKWHAPWRCYAFWPLTFTVFETQCLADISQFLAELMATRKAEA
jgi:hypothetical protein